MYKSASEQSSKEHASRHRFILRQQFNSKRYNIVSKGLALHIAWWLQRQDSNRRQLADAFARIHGGEKVEAYSAGSRPSGLVNPNAIEAMRELGHDLSRQRSKSIVDLPDIARDTGLSTDEGKVERAVPCALLNSGGEAAIIWHRPAEQPIHLQKSPA